MTARERPDVALVGLGESSNHALGLIEKIVQEAACPVIVLLHAPDPAFVKEASKRGVLAYITDADATDWQSSIDIVLRRFAEYHDLEGAFGRRALTERAKGILMERHSIDEASAFEMLRDHSRTANRKLVDVAAAVVDGHRLLPGDHRRLLQRAPVGNIRGNAPSAKAGRILVHRGTDPVSLVRGGCDGRCGDRQRGTDAGGQLRRTVQGCRGHRSRRARCTRRARAGRDRR